MTNPTTPKEELKQCPFCGGEAHVGTVTKILYCVGCLDTNCMGKTWHKSFTSKDDAIEAWNTRPSPIGAHADTKEAYALEQFEMLCERLGELVDSPSPIWSAINRAMSRIREESK